MWVLLQCDEENRAKFKAAREAEAAENPEPRFGIIIPMVNICQHACTQLYSLG